MWRDRRFLQNLKRRIVQQKSGLELIMEVGLEREGSRLHIDFVK